MNPVPGTGSDLAGRADRADRADRAEGDLVVVARLDRWRRLIAWVVTGVVGLDVLASVGSAEGVPWTITRFFNGDQKVNVPTCFKTTMLLAVAAALAALAGLAGRRRERFAPGWRLLAWVGAFCFVDESIFLHQSLSRVLRNHLELDGALTYAWTLVYGPAAVAVGVILLRYARFLTPRSRRPLLLGGGLYGLGAIGLEPVKSEIADLFGERGPVFQLTAALSDSLEMIGLAVLLVVLLAELARQATSIIMIFSPETTGPPPE